MANYDAAEAAILESIALLAGRIKNESTARADVGYAVALNQLAEARAWLRVPSGSHGGGTVQSTE